jgi:hypothetical protein
LIGSLFDVQDAEDTQPELSEISNSLPIGRTALLADVTEQSPEVIDTAMAPLGGSVLRRPIDEVEAEIASGEQAARAAVRRPARSCGVRGANGTRTRSRPSSTS